MVQQDTQSRKAVVEVVLAAQAGVVIVELRGEHDLSTRSALAEALATGEAAAHVVVDLSECSFIDSSVIHVLAGAREGLAMRGARLDLVIPAHASEVRRIAELTSLNAMVPVHATRAAALATQSPIEHAR